MNRSVRLAPALAAIFLAGLLVVLLALGWFSQRQAEQVRADLLDQSTMAAQLTALKEAADDSGKTELSQASKSALESLAPAAQDITVTDYEPVEQQLQSTVSALLEVGFTTQDAGDRARALTAVVDVWGAAQQDKLTEQTYPEALSDELDQVTSYSCGDERLTAGVTDSSTAGQVAQPASLLPLQESIYQLNYVSEVYLARVEQGYAPVAEQADQLATATDRMGQLAAPVLTCYGAFEAPAASYPLAEAADAPQQLTDFTAALEQNARATLADQTLATSADDIKALALILALDAQQLAS